MMGTISLFEQLATEAARMRIAAFPAKIARLGGCGWLQRGVCLALAEMLLDPLTVEEALTQMGERDVAVLGLGHGARLTGIRRDPTLLGA